MGELHAREASPPEATLRFNSDIGCVLPLVVGTTLLFGFAAFHSDRFDGHGRFDRLVAATSALSVGRVNVPILLLTLYFVWTFFVMGTRWADGVAARASAEGLCFHWTLLRRRTVPWSEVRGAELGTTVVRWTTVPQVRVQLADRIVAINAFEDAEPGAAERFVAFVEAHAAARRLH